MNYVILVTGLGSSLPLIGWFWTRWARKLEKRFKEEFRGRMDVTVMRVTSDGAGEKKALDALRGAHKIGNLGRVAIVGHSNGFRDGLNIAAAIRPAIVDYFAGIDMTLGEFGAVATNNIQLFHEFHAVLETADFEPGFDKSKHHYWKIRKGHTAAASDPFVQQKIFDTVKALVS